MENEDNLNLSTDEQEASRVEQRIRGLSSNNAKLQADKEELAKAKDLADAEKAAALKDVEFFKNFATASSKYQGVTEYQEQIREKVRAGYDLEDAMVSTLAKEGKFIPPAAPAAPKQSPVGGSAINTIKTGGEKPIGEMTQDEKRELLKERESKGELGLN